MAQIKITIDDPTLIVNNEMNVSIGYTNSTGLEGEFSGKLFKNSVDLPVDVTGCSPPSPISLVRAFAWPGGMGASLVYGAALTADSWATYTVTRDGQDDTANWTFSLGNSPQNVKMVSAAPIYNDSVILVSFNNTGNVRAASTNELAENFTNQALDVSSAPVPPPVLETVALSATGTEITLTYSLDLTADDYNLGWTVSIDGDTSVPFTVTAGATADTILITLQSTDWAFQVLNSSAVTVSLTNSGNIRSASGGVRIANLSAQAVDASGGPASPMRAWTDLSEFTAGDPVPQGVSYITNNAAMTFAFYADTNPSGSGLVLKAVNATTTDYFGEVDLLGLVPAQGSTYEVLALVRQTNTSAESGIALSSGTAGDDTATLCCLHNEYIATGRWRCVGTNVTFETYVMATDPLSQWTWARLRVAGDTITARMWPLGGVEPSVWQINRTASPSMAPTALTFWGRVKQAPTTRSVSCGYFAAALDGASIPVPDWSLVPVRTTIADLEYLQYDVPWAEREPMPFAHAGAAGENAQMSAADIARYDGWTDHSVFTSLNESVKAINPNFRSIKYISPRGLRMNANPTYGFPFEAMGDTVTALDEGEGGLMYPGHFCYRAGTTLATGVNSSATSLVLESGGGDKFFQIPGTSNWGYAIIYDAPAGSFNNAEWVHISGKTGDTLTLDVRGYRSTARSHGAGSIVAMFGLGQGTSETLWCYNLSDTCPVDGNGVTCGEYLAGWLGRYWNSDGNWDISTAWDGLKFDADFDDLAADPGDFDVNNDLTADEGWVVEQDGMGRNAWGQGMQDFYHACRLAMPGVPILGGTGTTRGFGDVTGQEDEGYPSEGGEVTSETPIYDKIFTMQIRANYHANYPTPRPRILEGVFKRDLTIFGGTGDIKYWRHDLGHCLLLGIGLGQQRYYTDVADPWYDEFGVDLRAGTYGVAFNDTNDSDNALRYQYRNWLGKPLGAAYLVYDGTLTPTETWDGTSLTGWSTVGDVTMELDAGESAIKINPPTTWYSNEFNARIQRARVLGPNPGTVTFEAKADSYRRMFFDFNANTRDKYLLAPEWQKFVHVFNDQTGASKNVQFCVGNETSTVWVRNVKFWDTLEARVWRRDFEHGIVVVNSTAASKTVALGGMYKRITGTQDATTNNGATVTSVDVPAFDAAILVRANA